MSTLRLARRSKHRTDCLWVPETALLRWRIDVVVGEGRVVKPHRVDRRVPATSFVGYRFPPEVILLAVRWYLRYGLSYRDVEELLAERGVESRSRHDLPLGPALHPATDRRSTALSPSRRGPVVR